MREAKIEKYLKTNIERLGGLCLKWVSPGNTGVPDRICILFDKIYFVELKNEKGKLRPTQKYMKKKFELLNHNIYVLSSIKEVDEFIKYIKSDLYKKDLTEFSRVAKKVYENGD